MMNVREGMARVARATAILYWLAAAPFGYLAYSSGKSNADFANSPPAYLLDTGETRYSVTDYERGTRQDFLIELPDKRQVPVVAQDLKAATAAAAHWASAHPMEDVGSAATKSVVTFAFWWAVAYGVLLFAFRGIAWVISGFLTPPPAQEGR